MAQPEEHLGPELEKADVTATRLEFDRFWHKAEEGRMSAIGSVPDVTKAGERRHPAPCSMSANSAKQTSPCLFACSRASAEVLS